MNTETVVKRSCYLLKTWVTAMPRILYRSTLSLLFDPKGSQCFIHQVLNAQDLELDDPVLGSVDIEDLLLGEKDMDVQIAGPYYSKQRSSQTRLLIELASLAFIMQVLKPQAIFEIGTFVGTSTRLLALNAPATSQVFTLDLPTEQVKHKIGKEFKETSENKHITQLYGDSKTFDFSPWYNKCDFVWVDGCHDYTYVVSDSQNALKICRSGGWIAWHDYRHTAWWSGVTRCVRELSREYPGIRHLRNTTIAVMRKDRQ